MYVYMMYIFDMYIYMGARTLKWKSLRSRKWTIRTTSINRQFEKKTGFTQHVGSFNQRI